MNTVVLDFHCRTTGKGRIRMKRGKAPAPVEMGNIPRITRLMALALKFDRLVRQGVVGDYAELARLGHVTRARMSQIMGLLNLATDIQEEILFLPKTTKGRDTVSARMVIRIASIEGWSRQRADWMVATKMNRGLLKPSASARSKHAVMDGILLVHSSRHFCNEVMSVKRSSGFGSASGGSVGCECSNSEYLVTSQLRR